METQIASGAQIIEVKMDVPSGVSSLSGNKICGGAVCDFSDAKTSSKDAEERSASMRKLLTAVILCIIFMTVEVIGGIEANSLAILTDAAHLLSDVAAFAISLFSLWAAGWEATPRQSYGFFRIEILGALVSIQMIWLLAGILVYEALVRIINDNGEVQGKLMFIVSAFGLLVNIIMAVMLGHDHGHSHGHAGHSHSHAKAGHDHAHDDASHDHDHEHDAGHNYHHGISVTTHHHHHHHHHGIRDDKSDDQHVPLLKAGHDHVHDDASHVHDHEHDAGHNHHHGISVTTDHHHHHHHGIRDGNSDDQHVPLLKDFENPGVETTKKRQRNINVHSAYLHVLGDSIQSIGVMIGGAIIWYKPEWKIIDLICTLIFSVIVLITTIKMLRNILEVLMESTPREIDATKLERGLCRMEDVVAIHELHIWAITVGKVLLACHVTITPEADADLVLDGVIGYIRREYNISHVTIQIERQ